MSRPILLLPFACASRMRLAIAALMVCLTPPFASLAVNANESGGKPPESTAQQNAPASTKMPDVIPIPPEAQPGPDFNAEAATNAYLAEIPQRPGRAPTRTSRAAIG